MCAAGKALDFSPVRHEAQKSSAYARPAKPWIFPCAPRDAKAAFRGVFLLSFFFPFHIL